MGRRTKGEYVAIETDDEAEDAPPKLSPSAPLLGDGTSAPATVVSPGDGRPPSFPDFYPGGANSGSHSSTGRWYGIQDLDDFFIRVYRYYERKGFRAIILARVLNLVTFGFVVFFTFFLVGCVNYHTLWSLSNSGEPFSVWDAVSFAQIDTVHPVLATAMAICAIFWLYKVIFLVAKIRSLHEMRTFYREELHISDEELQTIYWEEVQEQLLKAQKRLKMCIVKHNLTPLDIANRIMREDNYLIALMNKNLLNVSLPLPFIGRRHFLPESLEWNIKRCIVGHIFYGKSRTLHKRVLLPERADEVATALSRSFKYMALVNLLLSPFILIYLLAHFFFRYAEEFKQSPSKLGMRTWTAYARWRIRHLNELPQYFQQRLTKAYAPAVSYLSGFSSEPINLVARFIAFITGSFVAVLTLLSLWDENFLLRAHIVPDRSVLWFLTVFGVVLAISRALLPAENAVIDPAYYMARVFRFSHFLPRHWRGRIHTQKVADEFSQLFEFKVLVFAVELLSVLLNPIILFFSLPKKSREIVDFIRENSENVEGVGHVCSAALLDLTRLNNSKYGVPTDDAINENESGSGGAGGGEGNVKSGGGGGVADGDDLGSAESTVPFTHPPAQFHRPISLNDNKLEMSYVAFQIHNPTYQPPARNRAYLNRIQTLLVPQAHHDNPSLSRHDAESRFASSDPTASMVTGGAGSSAQLDASVSAMMHSSHIWDRVHNFAPTKRHQGRYTDEIELDVLDESAESTATSTMHALGAHSHQHPPQNQHRSQMDSFVSALEASQSGTMSAPVPTQDNNPSDSVLSMSASFARPPSSNPLRLEMSTGTSGDRAVENVGIAAICLERMYEMEESQTNAQ